MVDAKGSAGGQTENTRGQTEDSRGQPEDARGQDAGDSSGADEEEEEEEFNGDVRCSHGEYDWYDLLVMLMVTLT